jgi:hypothetical protein
MLFGAIGYTILENPSEFSNIKIILICDKHDEETKDCKTSDGITTSFILISEYLKKLMDKDYILLLEEIPSSAEIVSLWNDSIHVQSMRNLYLDSIKNLELKDKIFAFDVRLDLVKNMTPEFYLEQRLHDYIKEIKNFFLLKNKLFSDLKIYNSDIDNSFLGEYYFEILKKYYFFVSYYKDYLDYKIKDIPRYIELYDTIEIILSNIIEFNCVAKLFDLIHKKNKFIIYGGLYHIQNIKKKLIKYFKFNKIINSGIVELEDIHKITQNCSEIPL